MSTVTGAGAVISFQFLLYPLLLVQVLSFLSSSSYGPKLSQPPTSNLSRVKATTVVVASRDHEEEEVGTNPYEEYTS